MEREEIIAAAKRAWRREPLEDGGTGIDASLRIAIDAVEPLIRADERRQLARQITTAIETAGVPMVSYEAGQRAGAQAAIDIITRREAHDGE